MKNLIKKILILFIIIFSFMNTNIAFAQTVQTEDDKLEQEMQDVSNRLILSVFGIDGLRWYINDDSIDLKQINENNIVNYTTPFNNDNNFLILSFVFFSVLLGYLLSFIYIILFIKEGLLKTQNSGQFLGENGNVFFSAFKISIVGILLYPVSLPYTTIHIILFKVLGASNDIAKSINSTIISNQPKTYPTLKFPSSGNKKDEGRALISFMVCSKTDYQDTDKEINFNFYERDDGLIIGEINKGNCYAKITYGLDKNHRFEDEKKLKEKFGLEFNYKEIQIQAIKNVTKVLIEKADMAADTILLPTKDKIPFFSEAEAFNNFAVETATDQSYIDHWEGYCEEIFSYAKNNPIKQLLIEEKKQYLYLASRCVSHEVTKRLVYPTEINDFSMYLKTKNYLKDNRIELCNHDYKNLEKTRSRTIISESDVNEVAANLGLQNLDKNISIKYKSAKECLIETCNSINSENTNLFSCMNAIYLNEEMIKQEQMEKSGFLNLGAYMYTMFNSGGINDNTKKIFNNFKIEYIPSFNKYSLYPNNVFFINQKIKTYEDSVNNTKALDLLNESDNIQYKTIFEKNNSLENGVVSLLNHNINDGSDFLGAKRFSLCIRNSLKIYNGYSCGSVPEEMHNFGQNLFEYALYIKIMIVIYSEAYNLDDLRKKTFTKKDESKDGGVTNNAEGRKSKSIKSKIANSGESLKNFLSSNVLLPISIGAVYYLLDFMGVEISSTDEFGYFTTERLEDQKLDFANLSANGIAIVAALGQESAVGYLIHFLVNLVIFKGFVVGYIIPLIPLSLWLTVVLSWIVLVLEIFFISPLWVPTLLSDYDNHTNRAQNNGIAIFIRLFFKAPLICCGLLIAWIVTNTVVSRLVNFLNFDKIFSIEYGYSLSAVIDSLVILTVYIIFLYYIMNITMTIIEAFYEFSTGWMTGRPTANIYGYEKTSSFLSRSSSNGTIAGLLNPMNVNIDRKRLKAPKAPKIQQGKK